MKKDNIWLLVGIGAVIWYLSQNQKQSSTAANNSLPAASNSNFTGGRSVDSGSSIYAARQASRMAGYERILQGQIS